jgi:branched-subunit amino acid ABC-type transport system permease component
MMNERSIRKSKRRGLAIIWALVILALVLLVRPQGILGVRERIG